MQSKGDTLGFKSMKSIKGFILAVAFIVTPVVFTGIYLFISTVYEDLLIRRNQEISRALSEQVFNSMYEIMKREWKRKDVEGFLDSLKEVFKETPYAVDIYRSGIVEELFREVEQKETDYYIKGVFGTGEKADLVSGYIMRNIYPLKARKVCLKCHDNAKEGDVLGVIDVQQDLGPAMQMVRRRFLLYFLLMMPIPLVGALLVSHFIINRINRSIKRLHQTVEKINKVRDLKTLEVKEMDIGFSELNNLFGETKGLVHRMREIAIDKDVLEFEVRLLEKFIITSDLVRDWKEHVKNILLEVNTIMKTYSIMSIFHIGDTIFDLEIFWLNTPPPSTRDNLVRLIKGRVKGPLFGDVNSIKVIDNIADHSKSLPELLEEDVQLQTKTLFLEAPKIGGIMGVAVQADMDDPTRSLVIDSVLTTLLNVVGSVKAIYKHTEDLEYYATRDPLTDLYNQRLFWEMLHYEVERSKRHDYKFSILVLDIDNFKTINDTFGHIVGDEVLQGFADVIKGSLRGGDILARYGGDEFVAILVEADERQAYLTAERIREDVANHHLSASDGISIKATVSIGIATYPDHSAESKDLFLLADNMMYKAKANGRDRIDTPTEEDIVEVFKRLGEKGMVLIKALDEKRILPYLQPILDLRTGEIAAYEVLMRIQTPDGIMEAIEFIDLAEGMGVVHRFDYLLMEKTFERVRETGYKGLLFLNLSPRALILGKFIGEVRHLTNAYGIDPSSIIFELTERETVKNISLLERFVLDLKFEGFKFAIDDFGSGFSSFRYIKRFPIDFIKVDGEFIRGMIEDKRDRAFVLSISTLAKELGVKTVAEFVEDEEILKAVEIAGIDYAQGYHIGRPAI